MPTPPADKKPPRPTARTAGRPLPELIFGDLWEYDPAPETADPKLKARYGLFIGGAFFLFGLAQKFQRVVVAHLFGPGDQCPIAGYLVMFDFLSCGDNRRVKRR